MAKLAEWESNIYMQKPIPSKAEIADYIRSCSPKDFHDFFDEYGPRDGYKGSPGFYYMKALCTEFNLWDQFKFPLAQKSNNLLGQWESDFYMGKPIPSDEVIAAHLAQIPKEEVMDFFWEYGPFDGFRGSRGYYHIKKIYDRLDIPDKVPADWKPQDWVPDEWIPRD